MTHTHVKFINTDTLLESFFIFLTFHLVTAAAATWCYAQYRLQTQGETSTSVWTKAQLAGFKRRQQTAPTDSVSVKEATSATVQTTSNRKRQFPKKHQRKVRSFGCTGLLHVTHGQGRGKTWVRCRRFIWCQVFVRWWSGRVTPVLVEDDVMLLNYTQIEVGIWWQQTNSKPKPKLNAWLDNTAVKWEVCFLKFKWDLGVLGLYATIIQHFQHL